MNLSEQSHRNTPQASKHTASSAASHEYLSFRLGGEEYGIDILKVQEIRGYEQSTRMAGAPEFVKGVLNLRGVIVPIIDLRLKFGLPHAHYNDLTVTVILNVGGQVIGAVVDSVSDVVDLVAEQIKPVPRFEGYIDSACITGIGSLQQNDRDRMLILLDIDKLMTSPGMGFTQQTLQ